jgi:hypothetical protein
MWKHIFEAQNLSIIELCACLFSFYFPPAVVFTPKARVHIRSFVAFRKRFFFSPVEWIAVISLSLSNLGKFRVLFLKFFINIPSCSFPHALLSVFPMLVSVFFPFEVYPAFLHVYYLISYLRNFFSSCNMLSCSVVSTLSVFDQRPSPRLIRGNNFPILRMCKLPSGIMKQYAMYLRVPLTTNLPVLGCKEIPALSSMTERALSYTESRSSSFLW